MDSASGTNYHWGIHGVVITGLPCHSDCSTCTGPEATDCLTCSSGSKSLKDGICQCASGSNYWIPPGTTNCGGGCPSGYYKDSETVSCVAPPSNTANCTAPDRFGDPSTGTCV